ncbi:MAG: response regulator, partial [Treponema sp.]|nr:response regulator [Treponema sp.]
YNNWQLGFVVPFWFYYREVYVIAPVIIVLGTALMLIVCNMLLRFSAARIRADEENKYKSSFLARMSHEIRTPMNIVIGMSELIMRTLREGNAKQAQEYVSSIRHAGDNLLSIINDILDFSKIESGKIEIANTGYLFSSLLNDVLSITRMRLNESPVLFATRIDSSLPRAFKGDEIRIRQILLNILVNAVKYTREGYIRLTVGHGGDAAPDGYSGFPAQRLVPVKGDSMLLSFKISDTGIGIKPEDMGKLFEDFTRFDLKHNYTIEGTGLGLAISRNLCRLMGGDIRVKSVYGRGSVFTITLPQEIEDPAPLAELENPKTKNVLVYETQRVYADSLAYTIENLGAGCAIVSNKEDFLNRLENNSWQFVFTPSALFEEVRKILREKSPDTTLICLNKYGESFRPNIHVLAMPVQPLSMANILNGSAGDKGYHQIEMPGIRFIAPDARILIVDDINTNLNVAEGLMTPYKMKIDCCLSGEEAVRLVENTRYDVIFMDHMMPGMDGVETVAAIRKWEQEQQEKRFIPLEYAGFRFGKTPAVSKGIPIIALTANAISGMREMFIEKGFNDYLAKPIEIARLDGILAKWIPREKQQKLSGSLTVVHSAASSLSLPPIQGVDTARGLVMTGGTEAGYRKVLASFYRDAFERLSRLENVPDERGIALFTIHVHALKSAAATIGAVTLSADAAALEEAGNAGDINTIREKLPDFCLNLSRISKEIEKALTVHADESGAAATVDGGVSLIPRLKELKTALEARNIETVDGIIAALEQEPLGEKPRDALEAISYQVLMSEFGTAIDLTEKLLKQLA